MRTEKDGLPRMVNPDGGNAVAVVHGNDGTGLPGRCPKSKGAHGARSASLIRVNYLQLCLPFDQDEFERMPTEEEQVTWWLMIFSDGERVVRAELSLPVGLGRDSRFSLWQERIILGVPTFEHQPILRPDEENEDSLEISVHIQPKTV